jgi:hypothetical protein
VTLAMPPGRPGVVDFTVVGRHGTYPHEVHAEHCVLTGLSKAKEGGLLDALFQGKREPASDRILPRIVNPYRTQAFPLRVLLSEHDARGHHNADSENCDRQPGSSLTH